MKQLFGVQCSPLPRACTEKLGEGVWSHTPSNPHVGASLEVTHLGCSFCCWHMLPVLTCNLCNVICQPIFTTADLEHTGKFYNQTIDLPNISVQTLGTRLLYTVHIWNIYNCCHVTLTWQNPEETLKILESDEFKGSGAYYMMFQSIYLSFVHMVVSPLWHLPGFTTASQAVSLPQRLISGAALSCAKWWKHLVR